MTVSSTTVKNSYSGNGSTTQFAYGYKIFADSDLIVIIRTDSTGVETVKTLTTHYTVSGAGDASGGNVTFTSGNTPASGQTVVIIREVPQTQAIDYIANDPFPAESHEEGLDRGTMTTQQVQEELNRAIKLSRTNTMTSTEFNVGATDRANKVLAFNASGEISVTQELGTFKGNSATTTTAAFVQRDIVKATTTAQLNNIYICVADSVIGDSLTDTDHFALLVDAVSAATSATAAASSASAASTSATAATNNGAAQVTLATAQVALATTQANNSATSATASASSATASGNSATASANSATAAAASADAFDDIYLGTKSSDPSTDNDGDALAAGMLYFNSTNDILRVYSGSAWQDAALSSTGVVTLTGTQTLTNKTLTDAVAITNSVTGEIIPGKIEGTNFTDSLLIGHATTGTLNAAQDNTGVGIGTLDALTSGDRNTALGTDAGTALTTANNNTLIGYEAGKGVINANQNTVVGDSAFAGTNTDSNSASNTAIGAFAMNVSSGAKENTAVGRDAGREVTTGDSNIFIGYNAGANDNTSGITTGSGNVIIGTVDPASRTGDRQLKIAGNDGSTTTTWISGTSSGAITFNGAYTFPTADGSASQVLQTDGSGALSFATAGSATNTPSFLAKSASGQSISNNTHTQIVFGTEVIDTDGAFASNVFTVPSGKAGKYFLYAQAGRQSWGSNRFLIQIQKTPSGGSAADLSASESAIGESQFHTTNTLVIADLAVGDAIKVNIFHNNGSSQDISTGDRTVFMGYKLI